MALHPEAQVELAKRFRFEAAHYLPHFPEGHKCRRLHGHSFEFEVCLRGAVHPDTGILIDYGAIAAAVKPLVDLLDHHCLNDRATELNAPLLANPTAENLAIWLYQQVKLRLPELSYITVFETCTTRCRYPA